MTFGLTYSRFTFDKLDGINLSNGNLKVTFIHEPTGEEIGLPPFFTLLTSPTAAVGERDDSMLPMVAFGARVPAGPPGPPPPCTSRFRIRSAWPEPLPASGCRDTP